MTDYKLKQCMESFLHLFQTVTVQKQMKEGKCPAAQEEFHIFTN